SFDARGGRQPRRKRYHRPPALGFTDQPGRLQSAARRCLLATGFIAMVGSWDRMRIATFAEVPADFIARAHRMVWCDMATVGPDDRPRTRIVHPVWQDGTAWNTSLRVKPKANDIDRNP